MMKGADNSLANNPEFISAMEKIVDAIDKTDFDVSKLKKIRLPRPSLRFRVLWEVVWFLKNPVLSTKRLLKRR